MQIARVAEIIYFIQIQILTGCALCRFTKGIVIIRFATVIAASVALAACDDRPIGVDENDTGSGGASAFESFFPRHIDVFGVSVRGTTNMPDAKMLHAAHVMAEYLDNDGDGIPDNARVIDKLRENRATLVMAINEDEIQSFGFRSMPEGELQDLYAEETLPGDLAYGKFDAAIEEVLHLITHGGLSYAYPNVFGEAPGTALANAMDLARGGHFTEIPNPYPEGAWYSYDDETCDYSCMATEYMYWALTSSLGAQDGPGRLENIDHEWRLNTAAKLKETDTAIYALLTDPQYALPTRLPTGRYTGKLIGFSSVAGSDVAKSALGAVIDSIDISKTKLQTGNGIEYDFRVFVTPVDLDPAISEIEIGFPDGRTTIVTREYQRFDDGREHEAGFIVDPDSGRAVWSYINIGLPDLSAYESGDYTISAVVNGVRQTVGVPFADPDSREAMGVPAFPVISFPSDGSTVRGSITLTIEATGTDAFVFLGRLPRDDEAAADFAEEVGGIIPAGESQSESFLLSPGEWGGDVSTGVQHQGVTDGVKWSISVGAATEIDIRSIEN